MGRFIETVSENNVITTNKIEEFQNRIKILFNAGGMMNVGCIELYGKRINVLNPIEFDEKGNIDFTYNYYSEVHWENAGYTRKRNRVYSNKVGGWFAEVMCAAHVLETLYLENDDIVLDEGRPIIYKEKFYLSWFNYLFNESFTIHHWDKWKAYLILNKDEYFMRNYFDYEMEMYHGDLPIVSNCEVIALVYGMDELSDYISEKDVDDMFKKGIMNIKQYIKDYKDNSDLCIDSQIDQLIVCLNEFTKEKENAHIKDKENLYLLKIVVYLIILNSPILVINAISEVYEKDFWELYNRLDNSDKRIIETDEVLNEPLIPISTIDLFDLDPDDMIYYWKKDGDIYFSDELKKWFGKLQKQYNNIIQKDFEIKKPLQWLIDLLDYAEENYYNIMPFSESINETFDHITDKRYLALWKVFESICYDSEVYKAGSIIFKPEGTYDPNRELSWYDERKRPLKENWRFMYKEEKKNMGRVQLLRYLALIANKELREMVFGF